MKVVDETRSIRSIEEKIGYGMIEELIVQAHNELKLLRLMKHWQPWEHLNDEIEDKEDMLNMLNFRNDNPFTAVNEHYEDMRHDRPERKPSAGVHPEDK